MRTHRFLPIRYENGIDRWLGYNDLHIDVDLLGESVRRHGLVMSSVRLFEPRPDDGIRVTLHTDVTRGCYHTRKAKRKNLHISV